ncbi:hypothetical protein ACFE04_016319 [Oxalis oulophora]
MGNCQAVDNDNDNAASVVVIQHPSGKIENLYGPMSATQVMKMNHGHSVALLISTTLCPTNTNPKRLDNNCTSVRVTKIKILRPTDTLVLGQVYRLIPFQEVMKGMNAKKMKKIQSHSSRDHHEISNFDKEINQVIKHERYRPKTTNTSTKSAPVKSRSTWQPALNSISEAAS